MYTRNTERSHVSENSDLHYHGWEHLKIRTVMKLGVPQGITLLAKKAIIFCMIFFCSTQLTKLRKLMYFHFPN
jgi:hypothetical protein